MSSKGISLFLLIGIVSLAVTSAAAQIPAGNAAGVAMGHLRLNVRDVEANKKFFAAIGGVPLKMEPFEIVKFPDVLIFLNLLPGAPPASGGMVGTVVDHFGLRARNLEESAGKVEGGRLEVRSRTESRPCIFVYPGRCEVRSDRRQIDQRSNRELPHPFLRSGRRGLENPGVVREDLRRQTWSVSARSWKPAA